METMHLREAFSMNVLLSPCPLQECHIPRVFKKVRVWKNQCIGKLSLLIQILVFISLETKEDLDNTVWIISPATHEISLSPGRTGSFSPTEHWGPKENALQGLYNSSSVLSIVPHSPHLCRPLSSRKWWIDLSHHPFLRLEFNLITVSGSATLSFCTRQSLSSSIMAFIFT